MGYSWTSVATNYPWSEETQRVYTKVNTERDKSHLGRDLAALSGRLRSVFWVHFRTLTSFIYSCRFHFRRLHHGAKERGKKIHISSMINTIYTLLHQVQKLRPLLQCDRLLKEFFTSSVICIYRRRGQPGVHITVQLNFKAWALFICSCRVHFWQRISRPFFYT